MAIVQFTDPNGFGLVGGHANMEEWNAITRTASATGIAPGQPVQRVTGDNFKAAAWDGTSAPLGVVRWTIDADTTSGYPVGKSISIMTMGVMWVAAGGAATAGAQAGYDAATDRWADVAGDFDAVPGVEFDTTATSGNLVKIRINRPAPAVIPAAPVGP